MTDKKPQNCGTGYCSCIECPYDECVQDKGQCNNGCLMNKTTEALKLAENTLRDIIRVYKFETGTPVTALAAIREALAESKPAPDGSIPKTVFTLDDISKAAEMGRQAGMIDALAEPDKQEPYRWILRLDNGVEIVTPIKPNEDELAFRKTMGDSYIEVYASPRPVKQEPVAWWNGKETAWFEHELCGWQAPDGCTIPLYAAPVSVEAIRAEALEEAAKVCRTAQAQGLQSIREAIEEAIRGLK